MVFEKEKEVKPGGLVHYSEHTARGTSRKVGRACDRFQQHGGTGPCIRVRTKSGGEDAFGGRARTDNTDRK